jgi:hypothetical protein
MGHQRPSHADIERLAPPPAAPTPLLVAGCKQTVAMMSGTQMPVCVLPNVAQTSLDFDVIESAKACFDNPDANDGINCFKQGTAIYQEFGCVGECAVQMQALAKRGAPCRGLTAARCALSEAVDCPSPYDARTVSDKFISTAALVVAAPLAIVALSILAATL